MKKFKCNALVMLQELQEQLLSLYKMKGFVCYHYTCIDFEAHVRERIYQYLRAYAGIQKLFFIFCSISFENLEKTVTVNWVANSACQGKLSFEKSKRLA